MKRQVKRIHSTSRAWAIETGDAKLPYFGVRYKTRRYTRAELKRLKTIHKRTLRKARAVRVSVTVTTIGRG